ncbi:MAG: 2-polyprenylphenol 6-hydroxylase [Hyphomicrobiales bacterium]|nr:2-polyprenylphenol 6-hydroxylase [Hyphomicrobiales bacterium]
MINALIQSSRLLHASIVLARHGALDLALPDELPGPARAGIRLFRALFARRAGKEGKAAEGERLTAALTTLGPSYIKLGQFLATRPDIVGQDRARALSQLQDRMEPFSREEAQEALEAAFGDRARTLFGTLGEPVAAASIAQVHKARIEDDKSKRREVAVKILRPAIERRFARDLEAFYFVARLADRYHPPSRRLRPVEVVDTLAQTVALEMDLRMEAAAIAEVAENSEGDEGYRVPKIDWERSARRVLTVEWIDGIQLSDIDGLKKAGHDLKRLARLLIQTFLRQAMRDGFFHADMHPGNLFVDADGNLVAVDFGITGRIGPKEQHFLAEILWGFIQRDYKRIAEVHVEAGYVPRKHRMETFAQALRAIGEPLMGRTAEQISMARVLTQLFQVTEMFDMATRPELLLLQKTMVVVEGVARTLDPELDMWTTAEPVVREWIETNLGAEGRLAEAAEGAASFGRFFSQVPGLLARAEHTAEALAEMADAGIRLDDATVEAVARARARRERSGRVALWIGAIALAVIAVTLIM